jgi:hypothetical protein
VSFSLTLKKNADGVSVVNEAGLSQMPDGTYTISGHEPTEGMSKVATLALTAYDSAGQHRASVIASLNTEKV